MLSFDHIEDFEGRDMVECDGCQCDGHVDSFHRIGDTAKYLCDHCAACCTSCGDWFAVEDLTGYLRLNWCAPCLAEYKQREQEEQKKRMTVIVGGRAA